MLFEVRYDVVNADLSYHLKYSNPQNGHQCLRVANHEGDRIPKGTLNDRKYSADDESEKIGDSEKLIGCRFAN